MFEVPPEQIAKATGTARNSIAWFKYDDIGGKRGARRSEKADLARLSHANDQIILYYIEISRLSPAVHTWDSSKTSIFFWH
jgi:hypothetical protein